MSSTLSEEFLSKLVAELDNDAVRAIILHGSYVRGDATPPYSDVDLARIVQETPDRTEHKQYTYRDGYLISISTRPLSIYQERLTVPEKAVFTVSGIQEARILLDKDGTFSVIQQEARAFRWELLQAAADNYATQLMMEQTEIVLKTLRALLWRDAVLLSEVIIDLASAVTEAIAVQRGVLVISGNTYFRQVQEAVGFDSAWADYHRCAVGIGTKIVPIPTIENRGFASLRLYQETVHLLRPHLNPRHSEVIEQVVGIIDQALDHK